MTQIQTALEWTDPCYKGRLFTKDGVSVRMTYVGPHDVLMEGNGVYLSIHPGMDLELEAR